VADSEGGIPVPEFDPDGPQLIYVQIADHVQKRIEAGDLRPGERLPPERELATDVYKVAPMTLRRAMQELRERGLIETIWGRGTFVKARGGGGR